MKAAVFDKPGSKLEIRDVEMPKAAPGEMVIRVKRCGICGSDLHMSDSSAERPLNPGTIMGHEFCGEIVEIGAGVTGWKEGQKISALPAIGCGGCAACLAGEPVWCRKTRSHSNGAVPGAYAEYTTVGARESVAMPETMSWEEGALLEPLAVGLHGVEIAELKPGANILVLGAGPVGLATVACARAMGAGKIVCAARTEQRADLARAMGATEFLLNDDKLPKEFARICGGPPEVVFECVGNPGMIERSVRLAPPRSTVVVLGVCMQRDSFRPLPAIMKELRLQFALAYSYREFQAGIGLLQRGQVDLERMVTDTVGFDGFPDAFEALRNRSTQCKVMLAP